MDKRKKIIPITEDKLVKVIENITKKAVAEAKTTWEADMKIKLAEAKSKNQPKITSKQIEALVESKVNAIISAKFPK